MQHRRWLELVSDYDCEFHCHLGEANKAADALSQKAMTFAINIEKMPKPLHVDICNLEMEVIIGKLLALTIQPRIMEAIKRGQLIDPQMEKFNQEVLENKQSNFSMSEDEVLGYKDGRICVPNDKEIKKQILYEATILLMQCTRVP